MSLERLAELARGAALFDDGAYWDAHEAWETVWRAEQEPARRSTVQALIQVAAAFHKLFVQEDLESARRLLARALAKVDGGGQDPALVPFFSRVGWCAAALDACASPAEFDALRVPRFAPRRRFVVVGGTAIASADFSVDDLPSTSGRLDVLVRCLRAALLVSHGVRRDAVAYLVLLGGPAAPRVVRVDGATAKFLRPDERSLATLVRKTLSASPQNERGDRFVTVRPGVATAVGGVEVALRDIGPAVALFVLEQGAPDARAESSLPGFAGETAFVVGDHRGIDEETRARLTAAGAAPIGLGPVSVHAEDAVAILSNELDRRLL